MNGEQYPDPQPGLQMAPPIFQPRARHQLRPPSLRMFDDLNPMANSRMFFPPASSLTIPPPLLSDFPASFPMGASPSYGMLPFPSQDLARHPYLPSMDFGFSFPGGAFFPPAHPPPPALHGSFLPSRRQQDDDRRRHHDDNWNSQYQAHMTALQSHVDSFIHSLKTSESRGKATSKSGFGGGSSPGVDGADGVLCHGVDTSKPKLTPGISNSSKLHASGQHLPSSQPSLHSPLPSRSKAMTLPPLHLPSFKHPVFSNLPPKLDQNEKMRNSRDAKNREVKSPQQRVVEDALNERTTEIRIPKLPPLLIGNKDLARKLSEEERGSQRLPGNIHSDSRKPELGDTGHQVKGQNTIAEASGSYSKNLPVPGGNWMEDMAINVGRKPDHAPLLSSDLSDIEVMREAYILEKFHNRQFSVVPSSDGATVSRHSVPSNLTSTPVSGPATKRHRRLSPLPSGSMSSARPCVRSLPYPVPFQKEIVRRFSECDRLAEVGRSDRLSSPISVTAAPDGSIVCSSLGESYTVETNNVPSSSNRADRRSAEVSFGAVRIKQEVSDEALDFTVSSNRNFVDALDADRTTDLAALDSREMTRPSENPSEECLDSRCEPDGEVAGQNSALDEDGFHMPFYSSTDLNYASVKSCNSTAPSSTIPSGTGDERSGEFRCHLCNYSGRSQHCLNKHFRAHSQAYKICRYCMKAFERPSDLVRHEERHQKRNHVVLTTSSGPVPPPPPHADFASVKSAKRRKAWFCHQCDFSCHEARKLIVHTRKMHPIHFECKLCRKKLASEAELSEHKTTRHPVALGRIDTYWNGVVTATKLVTCEMTNEQEISISFDEILELPLKTDEIPEVSNLREAKCILSKNNISNPSPVKDFVVLSQEGSENLVLQESHVAVPATGSATADDESPEDLRYNPLEFGVYEDVLDLSFASANCSSEKDETTELVTGSVLSTEPPIISDTTEVEQIRVQTVVDCPEPEDLRNIDARTVPSTLKQTAHPDTDSFEFTINGERAITRNCSPMSSALAEADSLEILKDLGNHLPLTSTVALPKSKCSLRKKYSKEEAIYDEKEKIVSKNIKTEIVENDETGGAVLPTSVSGAASDVMCASEILSNGKISKTELSHTPEAISEVGLDLSSTSEHCDSVNKKCNTFICVRCKYSTNSKFKYQQHLKAHSGRFICKRCNKACIKSSDLYRHWVTHNVKGPNGYFACDSCDFTSPQKYAIENHMKQHYVLNPAQPRNQLSLISRCGICQKNVLRSRLFEHKRVAHGKFFAKSRHDDGEMDANGNSIKVPPKTFACPQCDRRFTTPSYLLRHHFLRHQEVDSSGQTKTEENNCFCRFCGIKFDDVDLLQEHEISHIIQTCSDIDYAKRRKRKKINPDSVGISSPKPSVVKYNPSKSLKKHSPRRKVNCPQCNKHFKTQYFLDQHMRVHSDERPFVCQWCGAGFAIFQYLNIHRRFKCPNRKAGILEPIDAQKDCNSSNLNESFDHSGQLLNQDMQLTI